MEKNKFREKTLSNGLPVLFSKKDSQVVSIYLTVNTGSNFENNSNRGISHFIEHMLFEGTKKRSAYEIAREIEGIGGEISGYTSTERTCFYVNCLKRHFEKSLEILSDIVSEPIFKPDSIEKERKIILSEVKMVMDEPRTYQWQVLQNKLFEKHPAKHPIIGYEHCIKKIKRDDLVNYHSVYYTPKNIAVSIVGNPPFLLQKVKKYFGGMKRKNKPQREIIKEPLKTKNVKYSIKRKIEQSYMVLGYKTVPRLNKHSYSLDVIEAVLSKGLSGRLFTEIRTKLGLAYDVGVHHETKSDYGFFAYYVSTDKKNLDLCKKIFLRELTKLENLKDTEIREAKNFIEGKFIMQNEELDNLADSLGEWSIFGNIDTFFKYPKNIKNVNKQDIINVRNKFLKGSFVDIKIMQK